MRSEAHKTGIVADNTRRGMALYAPPLRKLRGSTRDRETKYTKRGDSIVGIGLQDALRREAEKRRILTQRSRNQAAVQHSLQNRVYKSSYLTDAMPILDLSVPTGSPQTCGHTPVHVLADVGAGLDEEPGPEACATRPHE